MTLYTIGFTQKTAEQFFELIKNNNIECLVDIRLNNKSQLAGFTKGNDLAYFLKSICNCDYVHCIEYSPTKELLSNYQKGLVSWEEYEVLFDSIMEERKTYKHFYDEFKKYNAVCLLCSEPTPEHCHRRLVAEKIQSADKNIKIIHL